MKTYHFSLIKIYDVLERVAEEIDNYNSCETNIIKCNIKGAVCVISSGLLLIALNLLFQNLKIVC